MDEHDHLEDDPSALARLKYKPSLWYVDAENRGSSGRAPPEIALSVSGSRVGTVCDAAIFEVLV
jgi:hypothetical protein